MHIHPDRVLIVAGRDFAQIELNRVERFMDAAVISDVFQNSMHGADDASFAADVARRARIARGVLERDHDGVADFELAAQLPHFLNPAGL